MRKGILGSIAALAAGAGAAWGQAPLPPTGGPPAPAAVGEAGSAPGGLPGPSTGGYPGPSPVLMPPVTVGPPGDPLGLGPTAGLGPPPGPMYPMPGPYSAPRFQPPPPGAPGPGGAGGYGGAPRWWFDGSYLLWFAKDQPVPYPLLTTSAPNQNGLLGASSTLQLVKGDDIRYGSISGFRLSGGFFGDADRRFGMEVSGFYTEAKEFNFGVSTSPVGIPLLARPYIDTTVGATSLVTASPGLGGGNAVVSTTTSTWGAGADAVWNLYRSAPDSRCLSSFDVLLGYRFVDVGERFVVGTNTNLTAVNINPVVVPGPFGVPVTVGFVTVPIQVPVGGVTTGAPAQIQIVDRITTSNHFNGVNFGLRHDLRYGMFSVNTTFKLAVGNMHQVLDIQGTTSFVNPATGLAGSAFGGLYANSQNIGRYDNDEVAVIPEITLNVGINVTRRMTAYVGYNFLYINNVVRPGNHLNPVIDSAAVPFSPAYGAVGRSASIGNLFAQDEFYLHGVNFGLNFKY